MHDNSMKATERQQMLSDTGAELLSGRPFSQPISHIVVSDDMSPTPSHAGYEQSPMAPKLDGLLEIERDDPPNTGHG